MPIMNIWQTIYRVGWAVLILLVLLAAGYVGIPKFQEYHQLQLRKDAMEDENRLTEEMIKTLRQNQERLRSDPRFVERIAREELGYAKPGETVFKFIDDEPATARPRRP